MRNKYLLGLKIEMKFEEIANLTKLLQIIRFYNTVIFLKNL